MREADSNSRLALASDLGYIMTRGRQSVLPRPERAARSLLLAVLEPS